MTHQNAKPPVTQRAFANAWGELDYLCKELNYWLYSRSQRAMAMRYRERLERVLNELPENNSAIIQADGLALLAALNGQVNEAIAHRQREIQLMEQLHREAQSPRYAESTRAYMLQDRDAAALRDRQRILAGLKQYQPTKSKALSGQSESRYRHA